MTAADRPDPDLSFTAFHQMDRASYVRCAETYLRHRQEAKEAIDRTFEHLLRTWDEVLLAENSAAYAWTVMRNKVTDHARTRPPAIDEAAFNTVALCDAVDPIGQITESLGLFRALRQLTDRQQDVMVMIYLQGMIGTCSPKPAATSLSSCAAAATPAWTTGSWPPPSPLTAWTISEPKTVRGLEAGYRLYTARWSLSDLPV
ncbi:sigma-70 family RNA polymerase sigma factor [Streptomyces sp. NPDC049916]|uniref:sigma-70 family RNA polymerase sigma factor n=1 Tax=Streptomyces sp. NPDC049916 TaxID=3155156 RepID=UPI0034300A69